MLIHELVRPSDVIVGLQASDKWDCLDRIMEHLVQTERVPAASGPALREAVLARERSMSTGMERGIAIPHAAIDALDQIVACLAVVKDDAGINFESIDASPTRLIMLLLIPRSQKLLHIRTLAEVARVLGKAGVRNALLSASDAEEAWHALAEGDKTVG